MGKKKKDVEVTGRVDASGVPISAVGWSSENNSATIGGNSIEATSTPNDKAHADSDKVDDAIDEYKASTGIKSGAELNETYHKYDDDKDNLSNKIVYRKEFSYDPNTDPAYLAYKDQAERNARQSFQDILAQYMARSGGMLNSAAQSQASAGYNAQIEALNDKIPELEQDAFERYQADDEMNKSALESVNERAKDDYETEKSSSDTAIDLADKNADRQQDRTENAMDNAMKEIDLGYYPLEKQADLESTQAKTESTKIDMSQALYDYYVERAKNRGYFTQAEADYLGVSPNMSPYDMENNYWEQVTKPQLERTQAIKGYYTFKAKYGGF